jgi:hypothetical protein
MDRTISPHDREERNEDPPPLELIFSCGICQATLSEVYATKEDNQGFNHGSGGSDEDGENVAPHGYVTKMYVAQCSHITCIKHLPGGGKIP